MQRPGLHCNLPLTAVLESGSPGSVSFKPPCVPIPPLLRGSHKFLFPWIPAFTFTILSFCQHVSQSPRSHTGPSDLRDSSHRVTMKIQWPPFSWLPTIALQMVPRSKIHISDHLLDTYCHRLCYSHLKTQYVQTKVCSSSQLPHPGSKPRILCDVSLPLAPHYPRSPQATTAFCFQAASLCCCRMAKAPQTVAGRPPAESWPWFSGITLLKGGAGTPPCAQNPAHCPCLPCFLSEGRPVRLLLKHL